MLYNGFLTMFLKQYTKLGNYPNLEDKQGKIFQENAFKFGFYNDEILQQSRQFL